MYAIKSMYICTFTSVRLNKFTYIVEWIDINKKNHFHLNKVASVFQI